MSAIRELGKLVRQVFNRELADIYKPDTHFTRISDAELIALCCLATAILAVIVLNLRRQKPGWRHVTIPVILKRFTPPWWSFIRHIPLVLFAAGAIFLLVALADPVKLFVKENVTYPGQRIAILLDASGSMSDLDTSISKPSKFVTNKLKAAKPQRYYAAVAAAEYFVRKRMHGKFRDLMALIEFGNEAYVITPFSDDYENILTSIKLISEPEERDRFPDQGTTIMQAFDTAIHLYAQYDFLNSAGNAIVIFSDGEDTPTELNGKTMDDIVKQARKHKIPIFFVLTDYLSTSENAFNQLWAKFAVASGGKLYTGSDEQAILDALADIDRLVKGRVSRSRYTVRAPLFRPFAMLAVACWSGALFLSLASRLFRRFP